ncbi:unnamed protein product [Urochloa humidicola]
MAGVKEANAAWQLRQDGTGRFRKMSPSEKKKFAMKKAAEASEKKMRPSSSRRASATKPASSSKRASATKPASSSKRASATKPAASSKRASSTKRASSPTRGPRRSTRNKEPRFRPEIPYNIDLAAPPPGFGDMRPVITDLMVTRSDGREFEVKLPHMTLVTTLTHVVANEEHASCPRIKEIVAKAQELQVLLKRRVYYAGLLA